MNITHCITDGEGNIDHVDALFRGWERVQQAEFIPLQCPSPVAHRMAAPQTAPRGGGSMDGGEVLWTPLPLSTPSAPHKPHPFRVDPLFEECVDARESFGCCIWTRQSR